MKPFKHLIVIPARYASSRFPGKMLAKIKGKTLLQWTFENACKSKLTDDIIIATDDARIEAHALEIGAEVVMTSKSCPTGTDRTYQAVASHPKVTNDTIILNVQGDEPLINPESFDRLCLALENDPTLSMATLAAPFESLEEAQEPSNVKCVFDQNRKALYFSRSIIPHTKDASKIFHHLGVYAFRKSFLEIYEKLPMTPLQKSENLEQLKALEQGYSIKIVLETKPSFGVDLPSDIKKLEKRLCQ